ncbi:integrase core domain-containing protein [Streptomyces sp. NPDC013187]|uniref:integrase core domain-containing protein n=1 Tax=Streptomyces sp. NPDC013187 TaxID=3364865 RepID=UPI0036CF786C
MRSQDSSSQTNLRTLNDTTTNLPAVGNHEESPVGAVYSPTQHPHPGQATRPAVDGPRTGRPWRSPRPIPPTRPRPRRTVDERQAAFPDWLDWYNYHRPHTGIGGHTPASRVTNLSGQHI